MVAWNQFLSSRRQEFAYTNGSSCPAALFVIVRFCFLKKLAHSKLKCPNYQVAVVPWQFAAARVQIREN